MARALKWIACTLLVALLALAGLGLLLINRPSLVVNDRMLRWGAGFAGRFGVSVAWESSDIHASSHSFWDKELSASFAHLCVKIPAPAVDGCFELLAARARVNLKPSDLHVLSIGPVAVRGGPFAVAIAASEPDPRATPVDWMHLERPKFLAGAEVLPIAVELRGLTLAAAGVVSKAAALSLNLDTDDGVARIKVVGSGLCGDGGAVRVDGCLDAAIESRIGVRDGQFQLIEAGPVRVAAEALSVALPAAPAADEPAAATARVAADDAAFVGPPAPEKPFAFAMPEWLKGTIVRPVSVHVARWQASQAGSFTAAGALNLELVTDGDHVSAALDLGAPCADLSAPKAHACFKTAQMAASFRGRGGEVRLAAVGPIAITGGDATLALKTMPKKAQPSTQPATPADGPELTPAFLRGANLKPVRIELARLTVDQDGRRIVAAGATIDGRANKKTGAAWAVDGHAHVTQPGAPARDLSAKLAVAQDLRERITFNADARLAQPGAQAGVSAAGSYADDKLRAELTASAKGFVPHMQGVSTKDCKVAVDDLTLSATSVLADLRCDLVLRPERFAAARDVPLRLPDDIAIRLAADAHTGLPPSRRHPLSGKASAHLLPLGIKELDASADLRATANGHFDDLPRSLDLAVDGDVRLTVARFEALVDALQTSKYAVPAPLNALSGTVTVAASAHGRPLGQAGLVIPLTATSRLRGAEQSLDTDTNGEVRIATRDGATATAVKIAAQLTDVQLALPDLTIRSRPPQLVRDRRVLRPGAKPEPAPEEAAASEAATPSAVTYDIKVSTPAGKPAHLLSNLALKPIPLVIDYHLASATPGAGGILVQQFPLNLFRRDAKVDHFKVRLQGPDEPALLDGLLLIAYTDYTISITILGTSDAPIVQLTSDPPRTERELAAILLFGKDMSDLDEDQLKSAESFRAAAADGALSLASMYLLASTPVESVGYDPQAKAFTAKVSIGKGTSLNLGSDFEGYQKVGVRKRLGGAWSIETYGEYKEETDERSGTALLEWSKRY